MCKVLMLTNGAKIKSLTKVINKSAELITKYDRDGFGYAALGKSGVFGEKSIATTHKSRLNNVKLEVKLPIVTKTHEIFGTPDAVTGPIMFHGRTSTNVLGLNNTHPISRNNWHLIHNGVVSNNGPSYKMQTDNDTEHLVHYLSTQGIDGIVNNLSGYFAIGAISPDGKLHVARCTRAPLVMAWIESIHSYAIATTQDLIEDLCTAFKWKRGPIDRVKDNVYSVFDGNTMLFSREHTFKGYLTERETKLMDKSLHYLKQDDSELSSTYGHVYEGYSIEKSIQTDNDLNDYIEALDFVTPDCQIFNEYEEQIEYETFMRLSDSERLRCFVYLPSGELLTLTNVSGL
jgi:predicted glutamine amidotransferase